MGHRQFKQKYESINKDILCLLVPALFSKTFKEIFRLSNSKLQTLDHKKKIRIVTVITEVKILILTNIY